MLPKKLIAVLVLIVLVVLIFGLWLGLKLMSPKNPAGPSEYSAVYLTTGDIYFGKLSWFPSLRLTNVWFLQRSVNQQNQAQLGLSALKNAFWGPVDEVHLNAKQVIFWTSLRNDSQLVQAFANPSSLQSSGQQLPSQQLPSQVASGTIQGPPAKQ